MTYRQGHISLLSIIIVCLYFPTLFFEFTFDDIIHIVQNPNINSLGATFANSLTPMHPGDLFRPALAWSFALNNTLGHLVPYNFHLVNIIFHALITICIYLILMEIISSKVSGDNERMLSHVAFISALLWGVHPIHTESVSNIFGRSELQAHLFGLIFLIFIIKHTKIAIKMCKINKFANQSRLLNCYIFVAAISLLLGLLTKESVLIYPAIALILQYFIFENSLKYRILPKRVFIFQQSAAIFIIVLYAVLRISTLREKAFGGSAGFLDNPLASLPTRERVLNAILIQASYIYKILVPINLSADYSYSSIIPLTFPPSVLELTLILTIVMIVIVGLFILFKKSLVGLAITWFFITGFITSNVPFAIGTVFGERLMYLPSVGIVVGLAWMILRPFTSSIVSDESYKEIRLDIKYRVCLVFIFFLAGCFANIKEQKKWQSQHSLFKYQVDNHPQSAKSLHNYGKELLNRGKIKESKDFFQRALKIYPPFEHAKVALGIAHSKLGENKKGEELFKSVIASSAEFADAYDALGRLYLKEKRFKEALEVFDKFKAVKPNSAIPHHGIYVATREIEGWSKKTAIANCKVKKLSKLNEYLEEHEIKEQNAIIQEGVKKKLWCR